MRLWEILWSRHLSPHFHIYMCAAVLGMHRRAILESDFDFDGVLRFCIQLSVRLPCLLPACLPLTSVLTFLSSLSSYIALHTSGSLV